MHRFLTIIFFSICFSTINFYAHAGDDTSSNTTFVPDTMLIGHNYGQWKKSTLEPEDCQKKCIADYKCDAWTYKRKRPSQHRSVCEFKDGPTKPFPSNCCTSGVKFTVKKLNIKNTFKPVAANPKSPVPPLKIPKQEIKPIGPIPQPK